MAALPSPTSTLHLNVTLRARTRRITRNDEVQLYAFDVPALDGDDLRGVPLSLRKTNLAPPRPDGIFGACG
jgi:ATP-dependent DNA ligase